jgi:uncharacterized protein (TIGR01777 family)
MNILITGGTGFIGSKLCSVLLKKQCHIVVVTRQPKKLQANIEAVTALDQLSLDMYFDVVINLTGEPIAAKRWSDKQKQCILDSRLSTTSNLIDYFKRVSYKPKLFISGSAIGYYGIEQTDNDFDESALGDNSFSSELCQQWEEVALAANVLGIRTCLLRTGIVLGKGGALSKMLPPFKLGLGGKVGSGTQWMSWIHIDDLIGIILYCIEHDKISGAINGTAPEPVTNASFSKSLGRVLSRPALLPIPAFVIKLLMGQMGEELLLAGKKILPTKIGLCGYVFKYEQLEGALVDILHKK